MRFMHLRAIAVFTALGLIVASAAGTENEAPISRANNPYVKAVKKVRASVVGIKIVRQRSFSKNDISGTGVIIDKRGFVITNGHVVGSQKNVTIRMADGSELAGEVLFRDTDYDMAVVRIDAGKDLPALTLAPTSDLMVGEEVIAIGHPFGYTNTVSRGIISALGREITMPTGEVLSELIQTDAAINPGNSGGPLLNINGEFIGINVALREGAQNIAFAINAGTVKQMLRRHLSALQVAGVSHGLDCTDKVLGETGDRQRVVVTTVAAETPAASAGMHQGDEILAVGLWKIANGFDVERALWERHPGDRVELKVRRQGSEMTVTLTLAEGGPGGQVASLFPAGTRRTAQPGEVRGGVAVSNRP